MKPRLTLMVVAAVVFVGAGLVLLHLRARPQEHVADPAMLASRRAGTNVAALPLRTNPAALKVVGVPAPAPPLAALTKQQAMVSLNGLRYRPSSNVATQFTQADEPTLLEAYRKTTSLPERTGLIWVLAGIGGDETAKAFISTLTSEFAGKRLTADQAPASSNEEPIMQLLAYSMGFLAQRSVVAEDFLHQSTDPAFWQGVVKWISPTGQDVYGIMASSAIQALGLTGRPHDLALIERFKTSSPQDVVTSPQLSRTFEGDVVEAAFYADQLRALGNAGGYCWLLDRSADEFDADGAFARWRQTTNGAAWNTWYRQQSGLPPK